MQDRTLVRMTAAALAAAGLSFVLWAATHPWGHIDGAELGRSGRWILSHSLHFTAGLALLVGVAGLAAQRRQAAGRLEMAAHAVAFLGAALFTGTGLITAYVWPVLAVHAPALVAADGPILSPPHPLIAVTGAVIAAGLVLLAVSLLRAGVIPLGAAACLVAGAVLLLLPPPPLSGLPWVLIVGSGVVTGIGTAWLAWAVRHGAAVSRSNAGPASRPAGAVRA